MSTEESCSHFRHKLFLAVVTGAEQTRLVGVLSIQAAGTGLGLLQLRRVQLEGRRAVDVLEFVQGHRDFVGSRLGALMI